MAEVDAKGRAAPSSEARRASRPEKGRAFKRVNYVLTNVMSKLGLDKRLREHTLMNLWPVFVGEKWATRSRPLFIDAEIKLVVAVSDASTAQELSLTRGEILNKLRKAGRSLGIDLAGIRFDLKHYHSPPPLDVLPAAVAPAFPEPEAGDLEKISLGGEDQEELSRLKAALSQNEEAGQVISSARILSVFEKELRVRQWMRENSFPLCRACGNPARSLQGPGQLCVTCSFSES
jgi:hypothetical protein